MRLHSIALNSLALVCLLLGARSTSAVQESRPSGTDTKSERRSEGTQSVKEGTQSGESALEKLGSEPPSYLDLIGPLLSDDLKTNNNRTSEAAETNRGPRVATRPTRPSSDNDRDRTATPKILPAEQQGGGTIRPAAKPEFRVPLQQGQSQASQELATEELGPNDSTSEDNTGGSSAQEESQTPIVESVPSQPALPYAPLEADPNAADPYPYLGQPIELNKLDAIRNRTRQALIHYFRRPESASQRSPWGVMHALIGYGVDTEIVNGRKRVNAIGWLCWNGSCRGQRLMKLENGNLAVNVGPGVQGHTGQFLAMLAQSRVPRDYELRIGGKSFTVDDLIEYEKATCRPRTELTFKLIGLSYYLGSDASWTSNDGQAWTIDRLIKEELAQPVIGAACGGTHRLMGLTYAVENRIKDGQPIDGEWKRAQTFLYDFQRYTFGLQNPDGSFSTKWFERREARQDSQRRVQTTGHILEWLVYSLPEDKLRSPEVVKTVNYLSRLMYAERDTEWEIGPKGHAIHALSLYDQRVFGARIGQGGPRVTWDHEAAVKR